MRTLSIETSTHGRALVREALTPSDTLCLFVGFHGYAQSAEDMMTELERVPGNEHWTLLSIQGLHRFYSRHHERVVSSCLTRQDRELAIADNLRYIDRTLESIIQPDQQVRDVNLVRIVFIGFSQGAAMAYRAGILGRHNARQIVAIGSDVPPDVREVPVSRYPSILLAHGENDTLYTPEMAETDETFLRSAGAGFEIFPYSGGHEWTGELHTRIGRVLETCRT